LQTKSTHSKKKIETIQSGKSSKLNLLTALQPTPMEDIQIKQGLKVEDVESTITEKEIPTKISGTTKEKKVEVENPLNETVKMLQDKIEAQRSEIERLRIEKETRQSVLEKLQNNFEDRRNEPLSSEVPTTGSIERDLHFIREQTGQKLSEFDLLKSALLKDLENRCQKVVELEMLLDEAKEQYQTLLVQVKKFK